MKSELWGKEHSLGTERCVTHVVMCQFNSCGRRIDEISTHILHLIRARNDYDHVFSCSHKVFVQTYLPSDIRMVAKRDGRTRPDQCGVLSAVVYCTSGFNTLRS